MKIKTVNFKKTKGVKKSISKVLNFVFFEKCVNDIKNMPITKNKQALEMKNTKYSVRNNETVMHNVNNKQIQDDNEIKTYPVDSNIKWKELS